MALALGRQHAAASAGERVLLASRPLHLYEPAEAVNNDPVSPSNNDELVVTFAPENALLQPVLQSNVPYSEDLWTRLL